MDFNEAFNFQERQIISGYLSLMREKPHAKITVKELSERCAIARTTFYRFFEDTYDLLERLEQYLLGELVLYRPLMNGSTTELQSSGVAGKPYESIRHFFGMGIYLRKLLQPIMSENGDPYFKDRLARPITLPRSQLHTSACSRTPLRPIGETLLASTKSRSLPTR